MTNRHTGLAIHGFDPVAYFTRGEPTAGRAQFEYRHAGVTWQFSNAGNRAAFAADPKVYMPKFGGYDPVDVARGVARAGNPHLWVIHGKRLYLFHGPQAFREFRANAASVAAAAERRWPAVRSRLAP